MIKLPCDEKGDKNKRAGLKPRVRWPLSVEGGRQLKFWGNEAKRRSTRRMELELVRCLNPGAMKVG